MNIIGDRQYKFCTVAYLSLKSHPLWVTLYIVYTVQVKNVRQGKSIAVVYTLCHIETSSLWAEFVNNNRCISVRLVSEEVKSIKF